jgi:hypothetical protein
MAGQCHKRQRRRTRNSSRHDRGKIRCVIFIADPFSVPQVGSKGVDSVGSGFKDPTAFVRNLAKRESNIFISHISFEIGWLKENIF